MKIFASLFEAYIDTSCSNSSSRGWSGRAMALGIFQCRGVPLTMALVGQRPVVFSVGVDVGCADFFLSNNQPINLMEK